MSETGFRQTASELRGLLAQERDLLVSGRAREAAALIEPKLAAMQYMESFIGAGQGRVAPEDRQEIESIMQLARENSVHFEAIRNGLRHAIDRLEGMHANAYVGSYGRDGARVSFTGVTGNYLRKA